MGWGDEQKRMPRLGGYKASNHKLGFCFSILLSYTYPDLSHLVHHFLRIPVVPHKAVAEVSKIGNL